MFLSSESHQRTDHVREAAKELAKIVGKAQELPNLSGGARTRPIPNGRHLGGIDSNPRSRDNMAEILERGSVEAAFLKTSHKFVLPQLGQDLS